MHQALRRGEIKTFELVAEMRDRALNVSQGKMRTKLFGKFHLPSCQMNNKGHKERQLEIFICLS